VVRSLVTTPANRVDLTQAALLLHGEEMDVFGDAGYQGAGENKGKDLNWHTALKPGKRKVLPATAAGQSRERREKCKASIRSIVEHPFHTVKNLLGHRKARYRGLAKNETQIFTLFGVAEPVNLMRLKRPLLARQGVSLS